MEADSGLDKITESCTLASLLERKASETTCMLTLYKEYPTGVMELETIYECTSQRYQLLRILADMTDCDMFSVEKWIPAFIVRLNRVNMQDFLLIILDNVPEIPLRKRLTEWDVSSHYFMRLACSRLYESLKWFIKQEIKLFFIRWFLLNEAQRKDFLNRCRITLDVVPPYHRIRLYDRFRDMRLINDLFKARFHQVSELFKTRKVYLLRGWVYFKMYQAVYHVSHLFEKSLDRSLRKAKNRYSQLRFDKRYSYFFQRISGEIKNNLNWFNPREKSSVSIRDLDTYSVTLYPLCMSILHYYLKKDCHLRNTGRFQYNLFLKGIGLSLFDSIQFWRDIFTKKMSLQQFTQMYLYAIRHAYGRLGKKADYPPLSCTRILNFNPGPLDHHGCPFKNYDQQSLYYHLKRNGMAEKSISEILTEVENNTPQRACATLFRLKYSVQEVEATYHPNTYFQSSRRILSTSAQTDHLKAPACNSCTEINGSAPCHLKTKHLEW